MHPSLQSATPRETSLSFVQIWFPLGSTQRDQQLTSYQRHHHHSKSSPPGSSGWEQRLVGYYETLNNDLARQTEEHPMADE